MERTRLNEIMVICDNDECKEPMFIPLMIEACLSYFSVYVCSKCGHKHSDLAELKSYAKKSRTYDYLGG